MTLKISKRVPARTKTLTALWCHKSFCEMTPRFRAILAKSRRPMNTCYWCKHKFEDGEMMALAAFEVVGNQTLCGKCADELLASEEPVKEKVFTRCNVCGIMLRDGDPEEMGMCDKCAGE